MTKKRKLNKKKDKIEKRKITCQKHQKHGVTY